MPSLSGLPAATTDRSSGMHMNDDSKTYIQTAIRSTSRYPDARTDADPISWMLAPGHASS
eukprot:35913-Eustigmatos_ZCMA.PRE.1